MRKRAGASLAAIALASVSWGCEAAPEPGAVPPEPALHGARLVVGSAADQWSLVVVPRDGGVVQVRSLADPTRVLSTGGAELPPSAEAHALSDGLVVLRGSEGDVYTYDPHSDAVVRVGEVGPDALWSEGPSVGLFFSPDGSILEISRDGIWRYGLDEGVEWAAPAEEGVLAILRGEGAQREVWLLRRDEDRPAEMGQVEAGAPGVVTAWGRRLVLTTARRAGLTVLTTEPIEQAGEVALTGVVTGLTTSPSTHELYALLDDPPRLEAVNRFSLTARTLETFASRLESVRPSVFGDAILVKEGSSVHVVPVGGTRATRVASVWRSDLPLGLPGGILVGSESGVELTAPGRSAVALDGMGLAGWWLAVPWTPASAPVVADRIEGEALARADEEAEAEPPSTAAELRAEAAPDLRGAQADSDGLPPGFYAIVGSARQAEGMRTLIASLEAAGFATQIQPYPDEAGRVWYRGLVGPYRSRSEAEAASRQLLRERRLEAWVTEIAASSRSAGVPE